MSISPELIADAWQAESNLPLVLLEISHTDPAQLAETIRVVNNKVNITSNGNEYVAFPFEITLPDSKDDAPPQAKLRIDNVSREIGQAIRLVRTPLDIKILIIRQETPDVIEMELEGMKLNQVSYDVFSVEGDLQFEDMTREPYPFLTFNPSYFRGIL